MHELYHLHRQILLLKSPEEYKEKGERARQVAESKAVIMDEIVEHIKPYLDKALKE